MLLLIYIIRYSIPIISVTSIQQPVPFNISKPEIKIELSKELKEISGLTWFNTNQLGVVQDESGIFYMLNSTTGEIQDKIKFSLPGDFEGVERVGDCVYTLTSSGTLFYFDIHNPSEVKRIETPLTWKNDAEGLAYDAQSNNLWILCKESGSAKDSKFKGKSIFTLNVENHRFSNEPLVTIKKKDIEKFIKIEKFKPSGLAIDPLTNNIYIIASVGKLLLVLDSELKIINVTSLPSKIYSQPEGICFSPKGDLYISNEGKDKKANFYKLNRKNK